MAAVIKEEIKEREVKNAKTRQQHAQKESMIDVLRKKVIKKSKQMKFFEEKKYCSGKA